ncbi:MAG: nitroreductase family protein [Cellvibrionaceae bacterium]|nr:nitroreductase family protein [Cellvibrionaceae bacterium]
MSKAPTDHPIHSLLESRRSPYAIDPNKCVSEADLLSLFEAARWAMSSYNAQPWRYIVGVKARTPERWQQLYDLLLEGNQPWAANAPVLALGVAEHHFEHNGKLNKAATHDLGAASALLTVEAASRGLVVHQMIGIEPARAHQVFGLAQSQEAFTVLAIGYAGNADQIPAAYAERDAKPRTRKPLSDILMDDVL